MNRFNLFAMAVLIAIPFSASAEEWETLFNGKDLTGWKGDAKLWSVKDGAITGITDGKIPNNSFIVWDGKLADFELVAKFKIVGGNSGIQFRSAYADDPKKFIIKGYQADIDSAARKSQFLGITYEERGRGFLCNRGTKTFVDSKGARHEIRVTEEAELLKSVNNNDWNEYRITAKANHLLQQINGKTFAEVIDFQVDKRAKEGLLAFQIHAGMGDMTVQFKDIKLKKLTGCEELTIEKMPIPSEAKLVK